MNSIKGSQDQSIMRDKVDKLTTQLETLKINMTNNSQKQLEEIKRLPNTNK